ncbi:5'-nucleotidase [hydrothermal vent metagenome]|uniref:5'-nucleotidase n=1 Tax=hydrothermal vent metagenome TaxID=652676 RepID=A0A3B1B4M3_9ZZZZ
MNYKLSILSTLVCVAAVSPAATFANSYHDDSVSQSRHAAASGFTNIRSMKEQDNEREERRDDERGHRKAIEVTILHTNDYHSYLEGQRFDLNLDYDPTIAGAESVRLNLGGFARIGNEVSMLREDNTLVLNSGEMNGTLYFSLFKAVPDFKLFNEVGLDAYALGNHEFDEGEAWLAKLINMANFPIISANVIPTPASPLYGTNIQPYIIKEIEGEQVAVIGVLKVKKTRESSLVTDAVTFTDEVETVRATVNELESQGINKIIVLSHIGYEFDKQLAAAVNGVDAIIGGDTHTLLDSTGEMASMGLAIEGDYPTMVRNPKGQPVYIAQAWQYARGLGILELSFNKAGHVIEADGNLELLVGGPYQVKESGSWTAATTAQTASISLAIEGMKTVKEVAPSQAIESILAPYKAELKAFQIKEIGSVTTYMPYTRIPTGFVVGQVPTGSYAAHIVADAFLKYLPNVDVAIQNSGGVRTGFNDGIFTVADAYTMLPFSNTVVTIDMSGQDIVKVLEEAVDYALGTGSTGAFPYASHLRYDIVKSAAFGLRVLNVEVKDRVTGIWSNIDTSLSYKVATNSFTALGKDGYYTFAAVRAANPAAFVESDVVYVVPLIEYFTNELVGGVLPALNTENYSLKSVTE